jgi:hypothetical protein
MTTEQQLRAITELVLEHKGGPGGAAIFLLDQLTAAVEQLPRTRRQAFINSMRQAACQGVTVQVKSLMSGQMVTIPLENRGGPCDPSMERYWSM